MRKAPRGRFGLVFFQTSLQIDFFSSLLGCDQPSMRYQAAFTKLLLGIRFNIL
jgi:hypothetical protein